MENAINVYLMVVKQEDEVTVVDIAPTREEVEDSS